MANIIIIGTSRGIGLKLVEQLGTKHHILALSRRIEPLISLKLPMVSAAEFDLTSENSKIELSTIVSKHFSTVDVLINNAGYLVNDQSMSSDYTCYEQRFSYCKYWVNGRISG